MIAFYKSNHITREINGNKAVILDETQTNAAMLIKLCDFHGIPVSTYQRR
jgi:hypothetical protein